MHWTVVILWAGSGLGVFWKVTAQKKKFFIKDCFSKCDPIRKKQRIWSHLLKKSLMESFIFAEWVVMIAQKISFFVTNFFSKYEHIHRKLQISSHLHSHLHSHSHLFFFNKKFRFLYNVFWTISTKFTREYFRCSLMQKFGKILEKCSI